MQILSALLVPAIAIGVGGIAFLQWRTNHNRLKLELFDRRLTYYESARRFISLVLLHGAVGDTELTDFRRSQDGCIFLFNKEVADYLEEIFEMAQKMRRYTRQYENLPAGDERSRLVDLEDECFGWITEQFEPLQKKFKPFLKIKT